MFDWSGLMDRATEMFRGSEFEQLIGPDLAERLTALGVDSSLVDGLQLDQIQTVLNEAGVDVSGLTETQLGEIVTAVSENGGIDGLDLSKLLERASN
ncbi:MAG: hypothetical protein KKB37_02770 [Alphaproteobacteria bacterium]|nr:hypothetical protein [Alphaproteobacteria bacterium]